MKWLAPAVVVVLAVLAELTLGRASSAPDIGLFLGRFHPLVVHLPIGFFLLVAMGEAATFVPKLRERVEPALGLLLPVSAAAALAAFLMGQLLALEGGFPAASLAWHRRLTLIAVIGIAASWVVFERQRGGATGRWAYRGVMGATLGVLSLGAHFGGTMTRGESYLSKYAPGPLKPLLGEPEAKLAPKEAPKPAAPSAEPLVYEHVVQPLLTKYCVECHGAEKQKGKLRLDSLAELQKGGENGAAFVPGDPGKSPLVQRALLPLSDDDHMPPEDKPQLEPEELGVIQFWIERGASPTLKVKDALPPTTTRSLLERAAFGGAKPSELPTAAASPAAAADAAPASSTASADKPVEEKAAEAAAAPADVAAAPAAPAAPAQDSAAKGPAKAPESVSGAAAETTPVAASAPTLTGHAFLAQYCTKCHGAAKQKGKLRVDSTAAMLKGGADGPSLVPGSPEKSSLVLRLRLPVDNDEHMPPKKEPQPTAAEVAAFAAWVRSGAGGSSASRPASGTASTAALTAPASASATTASTPTTATDAATATATGSATDAAASTDAAAAAGADATAASPAADSTAPSAAALAPASASAAAPAPADSGPPDPALLKNLPEHVALFADAIKPLFAEKCGKCHIKESPAGGLAMGEHKHLLEGGYSGPGVVPKDRQKSFVLARIVLPPSDDEHMPPEGEPNLSADETELVGSWIDQGAPAAGSIATAALTAGAVRALSTRGIKAAPPPALAAQSGGCGACSIPGAPDRDTPWLAAQALALCAVASLLNARRRRRAA